LKIFNHIIVFMVTASCFCGCAGSDNQDKSAVEGIRETSYQVQKTAVDTGEKGVETIKAASDISGTTKVVKGVSQVVVDTSEDIGRERKGKIMGQDATLFPPETENDGKILKIEF